MLVVRASYEPCKVTGDYQVPLPFVDGNVPFDLTPNHFGGVQSSESTNTESEEFSDVVITPEPEPLEGAIRIQADDKLLEEKPMLVKKGAGRRLSGAGRNL